MINYVSINTILSKFYRDLKSEDVEENDLIEWTGEALEFLKVEYILEKSIAFLEVKNFKADLPKGVHLITQLAKDNNYTLDKGCETPEEIISSVDKINRETDRCKIKYIPTDGYGNALNDEEIKYKVPSFSLRFEYGDFHRSSYYTTRFTPIRLSQNNFYGTLVDESLRGLYKNSTDEYSFTGTINKKLLFSFEKGAVVLSYLALAVDEETGYPLIPDNISCITAITYYIKWKLAERYQWSGRQGYDQIAQISYKAWLDYVKQAKNWAKMPKSIDEYQNLLDASSNKMLDKNKYYNPFR
jgi:hypothetical protein